MAMLTVAEAQALILKDVQPTALEEVSLREARNRMLGQPVTASFSQPPFDASAMDGYAMALGEAQSYQVIGESRAGERYLGAVGEGQAVRIFTGAPVPLGANTVVIQENIAREGDRIRLTTVAKKGANIRPIGTDFHEGREVAEKGDLLHGRRLALIAATGTAQVTVHRRPKVAVIATGDELVLPGEPRGADQIIASSLFAVEALVQDTEAEVCFTTLAPDHLPTIRTAIQQALALQADVICLLGGASVGDHDFTQEALRSEGAAMDFWKIAMRPGKPMMFGRIGTTAVLGLPGNPVSTMVCATLFLKPLLLSLVQHSAPLPESRIGVLGIDVAGNDARQDHLRARLTLRADGLAELTPFATQDSSVQSLMAEADALIVRPAHAPPAQKGDVCTYFTL